MNDLFVVTAPGLEGITAAELKMLGIDGHVEHGGVAFSGGSRELYAANFHLRTASRVLVRVAVFHASTFHELERKAKKVEWSKYIQPKAPVTFRVICKKSKLYHSDAVAERLIKACGGQGVTSAKNEDDDDGLLQLFVVRLDHDEVTISVDSSGELLHRRGYRQAVAKAPLRETIAAAMLLSSNWNPSQPLLDPMCGSGTIAIEAALIARNIPPGTNRKFAFERWPDFDSKVLESVKTIDKSKSINPIIYASDRDPGAIEAAKANAERAGVIDVIKFNVATITEGLRDGVRGSISLSATSVSQQIDPQLHPGAPEGWIITNPPYGLRVGEAKKLRNLYASLGKLLPPGWKLGLLSASKPLEAQMGIPLREAFKTTNGGIPVRYLQSL